MTTTAMSQCPSVRCASRRFATSTSTRGLRATLVALGLIALLLMLNGEVFMLQRTVDAPDDLAVAACAFQAVDPAARPMPACTQPTPMNAEEETL